MRVLFLYPNLQRAGTPQLGIGVLSAVLKEAGHDVYLCDLTFVEPGAEAQVFDRAVAEVDPQLIAASVRSNEWPLTQSLLHRTPDVPSVVGGPHATVAAEEVFAGCDMVVRGEGEEALRALVAALEAGESLAAIPNVWVREGGVEYRNALGPLIQDLDAWPHPDWDIWDARHFSKHFLKDVKPGVTLVGTFEGSRGCPYACTYCSSPTIMDMYRGKGKWRREKSPQRMAEEVAALRERYPINFVYWVDEVFLTRPERIRAFRDTYGRQVGIPFAFMERPELVTEEKARWIAEAGAYSISIGLESGDEELRREVLNRPTAQAKIKRAFHIARQAGLRTHSFTMVGLPGQDDASIMKTFDVMAELQPDTVQFSTFYPLRGTVLYDRCVEDGYMRADQEMPSNYYDETVLTMPDMSQARIHRYQVLLTLFAGRPEPWVRWLVTIAGRHAWAFVPVNLARWAATTLTTFRRHGPAYTWRRILNRLGVRRLTRVSPPA